MPPEVIAASADVPPLLNFVMLGASHVASGAVAVLVVKAIEGVAHRVPHVRIVIESRRAVNPAELER